LLVIDDLVLHHVSSWALEKFIQLLIYRFDQGLKTVINYIELPEEIDQRIVSRFEDKNQSQKITITQDESSFTSIGAMSIEQIQNYTFTNFNPQGHGLLGEERKNLQDALGLAKSWSDNPDGWLVLIGSPGCGKTHLAAAICNHLIKLNYDACFASVPDLLDEFRASFSNKGSSNFEQSFKKITQADLLVLDDLGAHQNSPWVDEKLYQIFNYRYIKKMPTIVTKNLESSDLDLRIKSRLSDLKLATNFEILAPDYRIGSF
jgi:DNA replication protein DnaC